MKHNAKWKISHYIWCREKGWTQQQVKKMMAIGDTSAAKYESYYKELRRSDNATFEQERI